MALTQVRSEQIGDGQVKRADLNVTTSGSAVIAKVISGSGISLSSTGPDPGTGDVTINAALPTGMVVPWAAFTAPSGWAKCDGTALSRSTYAALFSAITITQTGSTTNGSAIVTGLSDTSDMRVGAAVEGTGIPSSTTVLTVDSGTQITLSANATATGSPSLSVFPYGAGDGSTTFNIPDLRGRFAIGAESSTDHGLGETGGASSHSLAHTHNVTLPTILGVSDAGVIADAEVPASGVYATASSLSTIDNRPPYLGVHYIIKT